jgi:thiol-disulfide isomerase/thioredoxin
MSGLLFLSSDDFFITKGNKGDILCHGIPGFSLILFYSTQCTHCKSLIPIFKRLPGTIGGCQFGMINVSTNKKCIKLSNDTVAPISYVPYIVLYIQGKPFMRYNGPHSKIEIRRFVIEVADKVQSKQKFSSENVKDNSKVIPEYSIGVPICGSDDSCDNICYLPIEEAYGNNK